MSFDKVGRFFGCLGFALVITLILFGVFIGIPLKIAEQMHEAECRGAGVCPTCGQKLPDDVKFYNPLDDYLGDGK